MNPPNRPVAHSRSAASPYPERMKAIMAQRAGGPEVLEFLDAPEPQAGPGQVVVDTAFAGLNFIDTYRRGGVYPVPFPHIPGTEGAGVVREVGEGVSRWSVGDRVAWSDPAPSYAERTVLDAERALAVPEGLGLDVAAALPLQGMTAHYLCTASYPVREGDTVVVTAAAGGVGLLLTQLATARGARVIGTVGRPEKADLARGAGAAEVIVLGELDDLGTDLPRVVRELTDGAGAHAVYDGIGKDTFDGSLAAIRPRGTMVLFGGASGQVPPFDIQRLNSAGSLFLTRPTLVHHTTTREELEWRWSEVAGPAAAGELDVRIGARYPLADARAAHEALESRGTTGKVLLEV